RYPRTHQADPSDEPAPLDIRYVTRKDGSQSRVGPEYACLHWVRSRPPARPAHPRSRLTARSRCQDPPPGRDEVVQSTVSADRAKPVAASGALDHSCWLCRSKSHWFLSCCFLLFKQMKS